MLDDGDLESIAQLLDERLEPLGQKLDDLSATLDRVEGKVDVALISVSQYAADLDAQSVGAFLGLSRKSEDYGHGVAEALGVHFNAKTFKTKRRAAGQG